MKGVLGRTLDLGGVGRGGGGDFIIIIRVSQSQESVGFIWLDVQGSLLFKRLDKIFPPSNE